MTYQRAIEDVYWRHRIWPKENPTTKPSLDSVMSQAQLERKVEDYLRKSQKVENDLQHPITPEELQAEMDRMAENTKQPEVLRELFAALGNDPFVIAECLAKPALVERYFAVAKSHRPLLENSRAIGQAKKRCIANANYLLPSISDASTGCSLDTWTATSTIDVPSARQFHTAVWTGSEMIVWGGQNDVSLPENTGGRYNPATDTWTATTIASAPTARAFHTAV